MQNACVDSIRIREGRIDSVQQAVQRGLVVKVLGVLIGTKKLQDFFLNFEKFWSDKVGKVNCRKFKLSIKQINGVKREGCGYANDLST